MSTLKSNSHHGFPITESAYDPENNEDEPIELIGHINRSALLKILEHRVGFFDPPKQGMSDSIGDERQTEPLLETSKQREQLMDILSPTPYKPRPADELQLSEAELSQLVDLRPFMQRHPWVIPNTAPLSRAYRLFRNMGLQYMYVIKERPNVTGVVSRKDLTEANAKLALSEKASEAASYYRASGRLTRANVHGERPPPQPQHQHQASRRRPDRGGAEEDAEELSSLVRRVNGNSIR
jgi:chloride channel 7